ncbi:MAG: DsbC family protein [Syntrophobacteraceae bacterium]
MKKKLLVLIIAILMVPGALLAGNVLKKVQSFPILKSLFPPQVKVVGAKDLGDIYELVVQQPQGMKRIYYTTKDGAYVLAGSLYNKDKVNLTQVQMEKINRVDVSTLPMKEALKITKGNGAKELIMFADVDCPFCQRAYSWLKTQNNYTLYVFFYPLSIHPQSKAHTVAILCSKNPVAAFDSAMSGQGVGNATCSAGTNMLSKEEALGNRVGVDGTPLFITASGDRIVGMDVPKLEAYLK